jgi:glycosyltransferase involved in cell wall biosynthesis
LFVNPLVSILIPAYNSEEWIADTVRSALAQTWPRKEIIIVDDGSRDRTLSIARQFASEEVTVLSQSNQGASVARNKAYSASKGDYIQWLDADDLLSPDKIARQVEALDHVPGKRTLLSSGWGYFIYEPRKTKFSPSPLWCDLSPTEWLLHKMGQNLHMPNSTWLVSRQLCQAAGPWDTRLSLDDDGEYFCRVILASEGVRFVPEGRMYYRRSGFSSLSKVDRSDKKLESLCLSMKLHVSYLRSLEDTDRVRRACVSYLQRSLIYFYPNRLDLAEQLQELAVAMGGRLSAPRLSWKYDWMRRTFGWNTARHAQTYLPQLKWSVVRWWDKLLFRRQHRPWTPANE